VGPWPFGAPGAEGWVLMLVPANRPADALSVIGAEMTEVMSDEEMTAVLRSWEERFGAVVTSLSAGALGLVVNDPPDEVGQSLQLAAEHAAFAPEDENLTGPTALSDLADRLREGEPGPGLTRSRHFWNFGWPD